ncbi:MAG: aminotransferase class I/II-fold pyridoxal phosphate-dependent enzyme [bacterium]|nr:aminotransferase class I/II-fold pyridoxal phosphate-dependent enzyme [bacterium]
MPIHPRDLQICTGPVEGAATGAVAPPITQTSLFTYPSFDELLAGLAAEHRHHVYTRGQNPTVEVLEGKIAALERGEACKCFASGMGAISAVLLGLLETGDHVVFVNQVYGPALELATELRRFGIDHDVVLDLDVSAVEQALRPRTRLIWFESPGTMLFRTLDVPALVELAKARGILTAMDNTWATPLFQKPATLGVDIVMHALSKYLGGHSDVVGGALVAPAALLERIFYRAFLLLGASLGPFEAWLVIRGLRTLPVRMQQHEENGLAVARFLEGHPAVRRVYHPGLGDTRHGDLGGCSGLFSFELAGGDFDRIRRVIDALSVFRIGVSWGGTESLVISPNRGDNAEALDRQRIPPGLIRLSVGLEPAASLIDDLDRALAVV